MRFGRLVEPVMRSLPASDDSDCQCQSCSVYLWKDSEHWFVLESRSLSRMFEDTDMRLPGPYMALMHLLVTKGCRKTDRFVQERRWMDTALAYTHQIYFGIHDNGEEHSF